MIIFQDKIKLFIKFRSNKIKWKFKARTSEKMNWTFIKFFTLMGFFLRLKALKIFVLRPIDWFQINFLAWETLASRTLNPTNIKKLKNNFPKDWKLFPYLIHKLVEFKLFLCNFYPRKKYNLKSSVAVRKNNTMEIKIVFIKNLWIFRNDGASTNNIFSPLESMKILFIFWSHLKNPDGLRKHFKNY